MPDPSGGYSTQAVPQAPTLANVLYTLAAKGKDNLPPELCQLIGRAASAVNAHDARVARGRAKAPPGFNLQPYARDGYTPALSQLIAVLKEPPPTVTEYAPRVKFCKDLLDRLNHIKDIIERHPMVFHESLETNVTMLFLLIDMKDLL